MKRINKILKLFNLRLSTVSNNRKDDLVDIIDDLEFMELYHICKSYSMTSIERLYALYLSTKYIIDNNIKGDFVECGVWKGGSSMLIAKYLQIRNIKDRKIFLFDTFEGMIEPSDKDIDHKGEKALKTFTKLSTGKNTSEWCYASLDEVKQNMLSTGFIEDNIIMIKGMVEDSIPNFLLKDEISLLRLDTDWYESTKHESKFLYPKLVENGVLIIDDFGHWDGAKQAVLEYFKETSQIILLNRIDYTGRIGIKSSKLF